MHLKRWITGLAALPFLIWLISKGGCFVFAVVISIVSVIALWEYYKIVLDPTSRYRTDPIPLLSYLIGLIIIWTVYGKLSDIVPILIAFNLVVSGMISLLKFATDKDAPWLVAKQIMGLIYIPLFLSYLVLIRNGQDGIIMDILFTDSCICRRYRRFVCRFFPWEA